VKKQKTINQKHFYIYSPLPAEGEGQGEGEVHDFKINWIGGEVYIQAMSNITLRKVIEDFKHLPIEEKEYALEILKKQIIETKREIIAIKAKEASSNYKKGDFKAGNVKEFYKDLESD